jgi:hypothetical protein
MLLENSRQMFGIAYETETRDFLLLLLLVDNEHKEGWNHVTFGEMLPNNLKDSCQTRGRRLERVAKPRLCRMNVSLQNGRLFPFQPVMKYTNLT